MEYDLVAEKVNTLPSREELESTIHALENDMAAIRAEHETQNRTIKGHKSALDGIIADLSSLRFMGKERETTVIPESRPETPYPDILDVSATGSSLTSINSSEEGEERERGREEDKSILISDQVTNEHAAVENDIEMGEVAEEPRDNKKFRLREELEEGEATDASSSELSEPPDD